MLLICHIVSLVLGIYSHRCAMSNDFSWSGCARRTDRTPRLAPVGPVSTRQPGFSRSLGQVPNHVASGEEAGLCCHGANATPTTAVMDLIASSRISLWPGPVDVNQKLLKKPARQFRGRANGPGLFSAVMARFRGVSQSPAATERPDRLDISQTHLRGAGLVCTRQTKNTAQPAY